MAQTRLTSPSGAVVTVDNSKVAGLLSRGFTQETKKQPAKKSAAKSSK